MLRVILILVIGLNAYAGDVNKDMVKQSMNSAKDMIKATGGVVSSGKGQAEASGSGALVENWKGGGKEMLRERIMPIISDKQMTTLDGLKSFDAQLQCSAEKEILTATYTSTSTGDIDIKIDFETSATKKVYGISAICKDGFKICNAGTSAGCQGYRFFINMSGNVDVNPMVDKLTDCLCINRSCNKSADKKDIEALSEQIIDLLKTYNIYDSVSSTKHEDTSSSVVFRVFSKDSRICLSPNTEYDNYGSKNPAAFYNPSATPDGSLELTSQMVNPNSLVSLMNAVNDVEYEPGVTLGTPTIANCTIVNNIGIV